MFFLRTSGEAVSRRLPAACGPGLETVRVFVGEGQGRRPSADRGGRSGTLLYKPHMRLTCCKQYTIRYVIQVPGQSLAGAEYLVVSTPPSSSPREISDNVSINGTGTYWAKSISRKSQSAIRNRRRKQNLSGIYLLRDLTVLYREKKKQEHEFDLDETVHTAEYQKLLEKDVKKILPEPAHKYEVKLEPAAYTDEKYVLCSPKSRYIRSIPT